VTVHQIIWHHRSEDYRKFFISDLLHLEWNQTKKCCCVVDKPSAGGGAGPAGGASGGGPMGLGALFAGGAPKLRPVGSSTADRSPGKSVCRLAFIGLGVFASLNYELHSSGMITEC